jgi:hypothetical protein
MAPFVECAFDTVDNIDPASIESGQCFENPFDHTVDCTCAPGETAISGGAYSGGTSTGLNASQAAASFQGSPRTWRLACVDRTGARAHCVQPFAVCMKAPLASNVRISTSCYQTTTDLTVDCFCNDNEHAISGGAYSGARGNIGNMLNASQAGPSYQSGSGAQMWRLACVDPSGARVACVSPFAVCSSL